LRAEKKGDAGMLRFIRKSIKIKLFSLYIIGITIPILLFGSLSYTMSTRTLEQEYRNAQSNLNRQIVKTLEENIKNMTRQSMAVYANSDDIVNLLAASASGRLADTVASYGPASNFLYSLLQGNDRLYAVSLLSMEGKVLYYSSKQGSSINLQQVADESWFQETLARKGMPLLIEPHYKSYIDNRSPNNKAVLSISRTIIDFTNSKPLGVVVFDQEVSQFVQNVSDTEWERNQQFRIIGSSGASIYSNTEATETSDDDLQLLLQGAGESFRVESDAGSLLVHSNTLENYGWKVITSIPAEELSRKSLFLRDIHLSLLLFLILIAFLLSIFFTYLVNKPMKHLLLSLRKLGKGDFKTRVAIGGEDEFSQIGTTFNGMVENMERLIQENYQKDMLKNQAEFDALQSQINPHFLFNTLSSILAVLNKRDYERSSTMLRSLSDLFRYSLNRGAAIVAFQEELAHIQKYLYIQSCRFGSKYKVGYDIDEEVLANGIVRLSLQPLVENAIIHGLEPLKRGGELKITAKAFGDHYYIYIVNNGVGISDGKLNEINDKLQQSADIRERSQSDSLGMLNVDARIKLYYGKEFGLRLYRGNTGETGVKITLPARRLAT
jgi:two-component system sensor histidine kinase YesM